MENAEGNYGASARVPAQPGHPFHLVLMKLFSHFAHGQQAVGGDTFVRHHTKQPARRQARIFHEPFKIGMPGEGESDFP